MIRPTMPRQSPSAHTRLQEPSSTLSRPCPGRQRLNRSCSRGGSGARAGAARRGVMLTDWSFRILGVLLLQGSLAASLGQYPPQTPDAGTECPTEQLAQYRVVLETFWSREQFPKHYPEWRPRAQWTKLLGLSHSPDHVVFREGGLASQPLKDFVEKGRSDQLDSVTYASQGAQVLDAFYAPAIEEGVGTTQVKFFADGNHSRVSMVAKIVPSPDWFIGVDSLQLCSAGHWLNATRIQLSPMDAGTDQGLAFTSPSWQLSPPDPIRRITHDWPRHPASSFAYPNKTSLPTLAELSIVKIREYRLVKPSSVKVPLPVYDSSSSRERMDAQSISSTTEHQHQRNHFIQENFHGHSSQSSRDRDTEHTIIETGHTLPQLSTDFGRTHTQDVPSHDQTAASNTNKTTSNKPRELNTIAHITSLHSSDNQPSHDSPNLPVGRGYPVAVSHSISINRRVPARPSVTHSISSNDVSVTLADSANEAQERKPYFDNLLPNDLTYNEVPPREQYDRQTREQQLRREQALQQHHKLLLEKRKKLKEKKRKHKERMLAAVAARLARTTPSPTPSTRTTPPSTRQQEVEEEPGLNTSRSRQFKSSGLPGIPKGDAMSVIDNIVETYQREQRQQRRKERRKERRRRRMLNRLNGVQPHRGKHAVDCKVGEWSEWSSCSKTCGIGEQLRTREVKQHPRRGGLRCPSVNETTWCGSARDCKRDYFKW